MHLSYKTVIEAGLLSLALGACAATGTIGGDGHASGTPINADTTPCEDTPGSTTPSDCQLIQGSGQMTPSNRR
jgi:hypothetical protein